MSKRNVLFFISVYIHYVFYSSFIKIIYALTSNHVKTSFLIIIIYLTIFPVNTISSINIFIIYALLSLLSGSVYPKIIVMIVFV